MKAHIPVGKIYYSDRSQYKKLVNQNKKLIKLAGGVLAVYILVQLLAFAMVNTPLPS
jgi:hypothetical protein